MANFIIDGASLTAVTCGGCGCVHAIPTAKYDNCIEEGGFWTCPNGCSRGYREGRRVKEAVQRERDRLKQENARLEEEVAAALSTAERAEKKLRRHQKRVAAGVCPCCKRNFAKLAMHMKSKHPEFGANVVKIPAAA
jgi:hypothetical protein